MNVYNCILKGYFPNVLDVVHLKMKYHNNSRQPVLLLVDLREARLIHETMLRNPHAISLIYKKKRKKAHMSSIIAIDLEVQKEDEILQNNKLNSPPETKVRIWRPIPNENFKVVQLDENPAKSICVEAEFVWELICRLEYRKGCIDMLSTSCKIHYVEHVLIFAISWDMASLHHKM